MIPDDRRPTAPVDRRRFLAAAGIAALTPLSASAAAAAASPARNPTPGPRPDDPDPFKPLPLRASFQGPSPWTGIVLWDTNPRADSDAVSLEYSYMTYARIVEGPGRYDWRPVERKLEAVAARKHQAILRFHDTYPGKPSGVPDYVKAAPGYDDRNARSEGKPTGFPDWSHPEWIRCHEDFHRAFAERYDNDPRLAYVQFGFGLWAEYHIYDGPFELGRTFPSLERQAVALQNFARLHPRTPWMISVDAAKPGVSPIPADPELLALDFGLFDDSLLCEQHARVNARDWRVLGNDRWRRAPAGGEFSYYTERDQRLALAPQGPHGEPFESVAARFHLTFVIGDDQPRRQSLDRVREAGAACGYRLRVREFATDGQRTRVVVANEGVAPPYHDAYVTLRGVRARLDPASNPNPAADPDPDPDAQPSLKGLLPGESRAFLVDAAPNAAGDGPVIQSPRLVPGVVIPYLADLA